MHLRTRYARAYIDICTHPRGFSIHRGTSLIRNILLSLIRNILPLGPYSRTMSRAVHGYLRPPRDNRLRAIRETIGYDPSRP